MSDFGVSSDSRRVVVEGTISDLAAVGIASAAVTGVVTFAASAFISGWRKKDKGSVENEMQTNFSQFFTITR